jgi:hypothetical protein
MKIINPRTHPIKPDQIDATNVIMDSFGKSETEVSATWIVEFCQFRGGWLPFTMRELEDYYHDNGRPVGESFHFNGLDTRGYLVLEGGRYHFLPQFIKCPYRSSGRWRFSKYRMGIPSSVFMP